MNPHNVVSRLAGKQRRIAAFDRRMASIHEAGHATMALYLGYDVDAGIFPAETANPVEDKTWLGHVTVINMPNAGTLNARLIAVSGLVAETLWRHGHDVDLAEPEGWESILLDDDCMSSSDWHLAGCEPGMPDDDLHAVFSEVAQLFMRLLWEPHISLSRRLMRDAGEVHRFTNAAKKAPTFQLTA